MPSTPTVKNSKLDGLLATAKKRGYISQDEILAAFPQPENHILELDSLYDQLIKKEIDIFETVEEEKDAQ
ncbi:MAG TPA: RNA polymerase sigma factor region1.1 domain-containing protein, partial [Candidatus Levybacteria bacterium]|nr:RNA polymerase sigma factor region1.1 domain-containing protein [Candidatus Levybacteria bacterium]